MNIAQQVIAFAKKNYNKDGWDFIIECYSETEIAEIIGNTSNVQKAIRKVARATGIKLSNERRAEAKAW